MHLNLYDEKWIVMGRRDIGGWEKIDEEGKELNFSKHLSQFYILNFISTLWEHSILMKKYETFLRRNWADKIQGDRHIQQRGFKLTLTMPRLGTGWMDGGWLKTASASRPPAQQPTIIYPLITLFFYIWCTACCQGINYFYSILSQLSRHDTPGKKKSDRQKSYSTGRQITRLSRHYTSWKTS